MHPLAENPFFILELPPSATPMEVERQGKKLLGMLELGLSAARTFATPYGAKERTPEHIREAVQVLLDPARRLPFEPWANWRPPSASSASASSSSASSSSASSSSASSSASSASSSSAPSSSAPFPAAPFPAAPSQSSSSSQGGVDVTPMLWWQP